MSKAVVVTDSDRAEASEFLNCLDYDLDGLDRSNYDNLAGMFAQMRSDGRAAGLEEAARECESQSLPTPKMDGSTVYSNPAALRCARAIRALKVGE